MGQRANESKEEEVEPAAKGSTEKEAPDSEALSLSALMARIIMPVTGRTSKPASVLIRSKNKNEHDLVLNQSVHQLAQRLREPEAKLGPIRLIPVVVSISKLNELAADEATAKQGARAMIVKAFEADYPGMADMLRQAMDMRALILVCELRDEAEILTLKESFIEELKTHRLVMTVSGVNAESGKSYAIPDPVADICDTLMQICSVGLFYNECKLSDRLLVNLFRRVRTGSEDTSYYRLTRKLHLAASEVGRGAMQELQDLLTSDDCSLQALDLSFTQVDGWALVQSLKNNSSITSLNLFSVPKIEIIYENISTMLLSGTAKTRLGYLRCEAFDLPEGQKALILRETPIQPVAMKLLAALLKHNTTLQELDLTASDIEKEGATALAGVLQFNTTLTVLRVTYNPALDEACKTSLREAVDKFRPNGPQLTLDV